MWTQVFNMMWTNAHSYYGFLERKYSRRREPCSGNDVDPRLENHVNQRLGHNITPRRGNIVVCLGY